MTGWIIVPMAVLVATASAAGAETAGRSSVAVKAATSGSLKAGEYACYGSGSQVLAGLGFKVIGGGRYTDLDGRSRGTYMISGDNVRFTGGHLDGQTGRALNVKGAFRIGMMATCEPWN